MKKTKVEPTLWSGNQISQWKKIGKKYKYWEFFEKQIMEEIIGDFMAGKRCFNCGKPKKDEISDICKECLENI